MNLRISILLLLCAILFVHTLPAQSQWEKVPAPFNTRVTALLRSGSTMFAGTYGEGVYRSTDDGASWSPLGLPGIYIDCLAAEGGYLFAGTSTTLYRTADTTDQWIECPAGPQYEYLSKTNFTLLADGPVLYTGTRNGVYRSTNHGTAWSEANAGITLRTVKAFAKNGTDLFASVWVGSQYYFTGAVHRSTDAGAHWTQQTTGFLFVNCFVKSGIYLFSGTTFYGIQRTWDNGATWNTVNNGLPANPSIYSMMLHGQTLLAGMTNGMVYRSSDNGNHWTSTGPGIPGGNIPALTAGTVHLFAGTDSGLYRLPLSSLIASVRNTPLRPGTIALEQNVPNPFNPSTTITYHLAAAGHVTLHVYDNVGRFVAALTDAEQESGTYTVRLDAGRFSSGMYLAVLRSNGHTAVRRLTLLR